MTVILYHMSVNVRMCMSVRVSMCMSVCVHVSVYNWWHLTEFNYIPAADFPFESQVLLLYTFSSPGMLGVVLPP